MNKYLIFIIGALCGCHPTPQPTPSASERLTVVGADGYTYRLVRAERSLGGPMSEEELWERINPLVTNRWYSRTGYSKQHTNEPPTFNSLMRFPDEQF